ncbi:hypothetical protein [Halorubrum sp. FL23]|uniref:hypothetical protein n=1 Tax=Halorubrum sp. FL23 TaxID=3458704 RepID=UPI004033D51B
MVSRENAVIGACILLTVALALAIESLDTTYPEWLPIALFLGGGVIVPLAINGALDRRGTA